MSRSFSEQDRCDLREIFRIYDFSKVEKVGDVVADAEKKGTSPAELFDNLYAFYNIKKLPQRDAVAKRLHMAVTTASEADVESALREAEMKGFSERDAVRALERKHNVRRVSNRTLQTTRKNLNSVQDDAVAEEPSELLRTASQLRHVNVNESSTSFLSGSVSASKPENFGGNAHDGEPTVIVARPPSSLCAPPTQENLDEIMSEEVREWLAKILGETYNRDVLAMANFIDALRNGVLLHVLLQKMEDPPVADAALKLPKRSTGFFIRDNVATFLKEAKNRFHLVDAQLFTDSDLVDGKSDRQVVTCLMAMARIAYSAGTIKLAPSIIMYEREIEQRSAQLTKKELDRIVSEAMASEDQGIPTLQRDGLTEEERPSTEREKSASDSSLKEVAGENAVVGVHAAGPHRGDAAQGEAPSPVAVKETSSSSTAPEKSTREGSEVASDHGEEAPGTALRGATPLGTSPLTTVVHTLSPTKPSRSRDHSAVRERRTRIDETESSSRTSSAPHAVADDVKEATAMTGKSSPTPSSEDRHTLPKRDASPVGTPNTPSVPQTDNNNVESSEEDEREDGDDDGAGGRVFYLRNNMLQSTRPTPEEKLKQQAKRKMAAPRVVWKSPNLPLTTAMPPRYHSRHWDGIDIALGQHLNKHYEAHPQSPWRFHMVASTSGEYVLHNRQNAQKRVVYLRIIQTRLFLRNTGANQQWVRIDEALTALENSR
ncbi:hypothetical protein ABL78_5338 [Leptomonas seymouri]|uniref:Calponin-homology (CH) domain-containing protein n=1 Tax=Leptomonas seymouri TaxID=5684 RepID=A0A0N1IJX5_LEPSE|nr:hypothetical protein ABL78_5338 [Leptomonas seymouri]|eukprot:KPI85600.1 hypothetical protein ABL78_5338 [Leptomonas seymouri]